MSALAPSLALIFPDWLDILNRNAFVSINSHWTSPTLDLIIPLLRNPFFWAPFYAFLISLLLINYKGKGIYIILFALIGFFLTDQLSAHLLKPLFGMPRPCQDYFMFGQVRSLVRCGVGYGFPSSHASNHFGLAVFFIYVLGNKIKWMTPFMLFWAAIISYAQVYVGLHFPLDVLAGAILGTLVGLWSGYLCKRALKALETAEGNNNL